MTYIEGFVVAVPAANQDAYRRHSETVLPLFKGLGVTRMVQTWGDEVPDGKVTDSRVRCRQNRMRSWSSPGSSIRRRRCAMRRTRR